MRHVKNLEQFYQVPAKEVLIYWGDMRRSVEIELNAVGPCAAYVQKVEVDRDAGPKAKPKYIGERYLLGTFEGLEAFRWSLDGNFAVILEPSGEVWARRDQTPLSVPNPDTEVYTRFEKAGLYVDELGTLLHRQAVLQRMAASSAMGEERRQTSVMERRLIELEEKLAKLQPQVEEQSTEPVA